MKKLLPILTSATLSLTLLAACAPEATKSTDQPTQPAQPQTGATPGAQAAQGDRINLSNCATPTDGRVYFKVGQNVLAVPANAVRDVIPASLKPPVRKEDVKSALQAEAARGGGCQGRPLDASLLLVQSDLGHPLLQGSLGLLATPPQGISGPFAKVTRTLQQKPTENCKAIGGGLIGCVGSETRGEARTPVMYVIATDPNQNLAGGGPLAARCVLQGEKVAGCSMVDQLSGQLAFDATLAPGTYSADGLRDARQRVETVINGLRQN